MKFTAQPLEDYIPPVNIQIVGMVAGFFGVFFIGDAVTGVGFFGFLAGAILGVPGGLAGSYILHYVRLAPLRREDEERYWASIERRKQEAVERQDRQEEMARLRRVDPGEYERQCRLQREERSRKVAERRAELDAIIERGNSRMGR